MNLFTTINTETAQAMKKRTVKRASIFDELVESFVQAGIKYASVDPDVFGPDKNGNKRSAQATAQAIMTYVKSHEEYSAIEASAGKYSQQILLENTAVEED